MMNKAPSNSTDNLHMFGVADVNSWFKTASANNTVSDLIIGLSSDAQACLEKGLDTRANWILNRIKWLAANKLNVG